MMTDEQMKTQADRIKAAAHKFADGVVSGDMEQHDEFKRRLHHGTLVLAFTFLAYHHLEPKPRWRRYTRKERSLANS